MPFNVKWHDYRREPQCPPNPAYPLGIDIVEIEDPRAPICETPLPYPAKRCGLYVVTCTDCGFTVAITTAGRADDPRSLKINCQKIHQSEGTA